MQHPCNCGASGTMKWRQFSGASSCGGGTGLIPVQFGVGHLDYPVSCPVCLGFGPTPQTEESLSVLPVRNLELETKQLRSN